MWPAHKVTSRMWNAITSALKPIIMPIRTLIVIRQERAAQVPISDVEDVVARRATVDNLPMGVEVFAIEVVDAEDRVLAFGVGGLHNGEVGEGEREEGECEE